MVAQVGRNDPCPCGSGKKFKRCCGQYGITEIDTFASQFRRAIVTYVDRHPKIVEKTMLQVVEDVRSCAMNQEVWRTEKYDAERLNIALGEIQKAATGWFAKSPHSRHHWYPLVRISTPIFLSRFDPEIRSRLAVPVSKSSKSHYPDLFHEVLLIASELTLACQESARPEEWVDLENTGGIGYEITNLEIEVLAALASLARLKEKVQINYRYACKGIPVFELEKLWTPLTQRRNESIAIYEQRKANFQTLAGSAGIWYDPYAVIVRMPDWAGLWAVRGVKANTFRIISKNPACFIKMSWLLSPFSEPRRVSHSNLQIKPGITKVPPGFPHPIEAMLPYDAIFEDFATSFQKGIGVSAPELNSFLYALYSMVKQNLAFDILDWESKSPNLTLEWRPELDQTIRETTLKHLDDVCEMAIMRSSKANWVTHLAAHSHFFPTDGDSIKPLEASQIEAIISKFTLDKPRDPGKDSPFLFIKLSDHTLVLDLLGAVNFVRDLFLRISQAGREKPEGQKQDQGDETGKWLENQAAIFFARELNIDPQKMIVGAKIDGGKREVDLAFVYRQNLFVIDCKAAAKDSLYNAGENNKIRNRITTFSIELSENNPDRINLISQGAGAPAINPSEFSRAHSLVCTSAVEYLPLKNAEFENMKSKNGDPLKVDLWVDKFPVVGPPEELLVTIRHLAGG